MDLCVDGGADYVKTSTGWYPAHPSALEQIQIMADQAAGRIKIKAAGGIRSLGNHICHAASRCSRFGMGLSSALTLFRDIP